MPTVFPKASDCCFPPSLIVAVDGGCMRGETRKALFFLQGSGEVCYLLPDHGVKRADGGESGSIPMLFELMTMKLWTMRKK